MAIHIERREFIVALGSAMRKPLAGDERRNSPRLFLESSSRPDLF
jgi:hypothetical protein